MTDVTRWREAGKGKHWAPPALPEPPRHSRVAKSAPEPRDTVGRDLEDWMRTQTVTRTHDGE